MKPLSYYQTTSVSIPRQEDYMTIYYYKKGVMVGMKVGKLDEDFIPPKNCVEEKVLDEISYNAHMKLYQEEILRLQEEFREDLIEKYNMKDHPKVNKVFNKAWDLGCSMGLESVEYYFKDLMELFNDDNNYEQMNYIFITLRETLNILGTHITNAFIFHFRRTFIQFRSDNKF